MMTQEEIQLITDDGSSSLAATATSRLLQILPTEQTDDEPELFRKVLATILGLLGLIATVALTYVVAMLCDTTVRICAPFRRGETENEVAPQSLNRDRIDIEVRKQIVKELFADETFLYSSPMKTATAPARGKEDGEDEAGIQLQDISMKDEHTVETDEDSSEVASPAKQVVTVISHKNASTTSVEQDDSEVFTSNEAACCICLAPYREGESILRSKHCTHMFHASCCEDWIMQKPVCPLCAKPMILDAEWEATAATVLGQERYDALLLEQRGERTEEHSHSASV